MQEPKPDPVSPELAGLRGRRLGTCASCGEGVFAAQSFTRFHGCVTHVRCASRGRSSTMSAAARTMPRRRVQAR